MAQRLNKVIELLAAGKVVFGGAFASTGNMDDPLAYADLRYDFVIFEMEHEGFDLPGLRLSLQFLLDRKRIAKTGSLQPDIVPMVRIPPNARENNQWIVKQALDAGVYGIVLPHLDSVDQAKAAVVAARYPQATGVADRLPIGERGLWQRIAPRYWGLSPAEYYDRADIWPLDPEGELFLMPIVEGIKGIENLGDILREVKGISAIWAGSADLSAELGARGDIHHASVEDGLQKILATCKAFDVPCAVYASAADVEKRVEQGFRIIISSPSRVDPALKLGRAAAQSRPGFRPP
ncbi:MAG: aldolase/citrate lyase family protein [Burkholderiaceae bacterium]|nr:aldolase/citrate lyase family protein [Burkholderiaceae bacterium]